MPSKYMWRYFIDGVWNFREMLLMLRLEVLLWQPGPLGFLIEGEIFFDVFSWFFFCM